MKFKSPLTRGTLIKRYKRFLADVELDDGRIIIAHCANSGSMMGVKEPGSTVWLAPNLNPKAKLDWRWELLEVDGRLVGINTHHPNHIVEEAILDEQVPELTGYAGLRREVKYGQNSRIDILLENPHASDQSRLCYVEVKNVTLRQNGRAEFPDAVTARGTKHLRELAEMKREGHRAVMFYLINRMDCDSFSLAREIDPAYATAFGKAMDAGVEALAYACLLTTKAIRVERKIPIEY